MTTIEWKDTPKHPWNAYATKVQNSTSPSLEDDLNATMMFIIRKTSISELVEKVIESASTGSEHMTEPNIINGFAVIIALAHLSPLKMKLVMDDEQAELFDKLIKQEGQINYLEKSITDQHPELNSLIDRFIENEILIDKEDKYIIDVAILGDVKVSL